MNECKLVNRKADGLPPQRVMSIFGTWAKKGRFGESLFLSEPP